MNNVGPNDIKQIQERREKWAALEDAIRTHLNYRIITNPPKDRICLSTEKLDTVLAAHNGQIVRLLPDINALITEEGGVYHVKGGQVCCERVSQIFSDTWKEMYERLIGKGQGAQPPVTIISADTSWEGLTYETVLINLRSCFDHLPTSDLPDPPDAAEELETKERFIKEHKICNLFGLNKWHQITDEGKTAKSLMNGELQDMMNPDKVPDYLEMIGKAQEQNSTGQNQSGHVNQNLAENEKESEKNNLNNTQENAHNAQKEPQIMPVDPTAELPHPSLTQEDIDAQREWWRIFMQEVRNQYNYNVINDVTLQNKLTTITVPPYHDSGIITAIGLLHGFECCDQGPDPLVLQWYSYNTDQPSMTNHSGATLLKAAQVLTVEFHNEVKAKIGEMVGGFGNLETAYRDGTLEAYIITVYELLRKAKKQAVESATIQTQYSNNQSKCNEIKMHHSTTLLTDELLESVPYHATNGGDDRWYDNLVAHVRADQLTNFQTICQRPQQTNLNQANIRKEDDNNQNGELDYTENINNCIENDEGRSGGTKRKDETAKSKIATASSIPLVTQNTNNIENPSQNPPPETDTFTRTTKPVSNKLPKNQGWHLSNELECVTVW